jgi:Elongation factor SelB, winged helix.
MKWGQGEEGYAQVFLGTPTTAVAGDRFVIRSYSPVTTIGGGKILDPLACKHKRHSDRTKSDFNLLQNGSDPERTGIIIDRVALNGITFPELVVRTGINPNRLDGILREMSAKRQIIMLNRDAVSIVSATAYKGLQEKILSETEEYHKKFPLQEGLLKEELRTEVGRFIDSGLFNMAISDLEKTRKIVTDKKNVRIADHAVNLDGKLMELKRETEKIYLKSGLTPPPTKELPTRFKEGGDQIESILKVMLNEGILIKVSEGMCFHKDILSKLRKDYGNLLQNDGKSTPASFKDMTGLSRKFIIPLIEYFDRTRFTIRVGDHRVLRERKEQ